MRKMLFGLGILLVLFLLAGCQQADSFVPTVTPTVTVKPTVTIAPTPKATVKPTPTATPVPERTIDPAFTNGDFAELVLEKVNNARIEYDLEPLEMSPSLCAAAAIRADEYRQKLDAKFGVGHVTGTGSFTRSEMHSRLNGDNFSTVLDEIGITNWDWASENVTANSQSDYGATVDSFRAFNWWKNSPDHWEAILYKNYTKTGIAVVYSNGIAYACQLFTTGHNEAPEYNTPTTTP